MAHSNEILTIANKVSQMDSYFQSLVDTNKWLFRKAESITSNNYDDKEGYGWSTCSEQAIMSTYYQLKALMVDNEITEEEVMNY